MAEMPDAGENHGKACIIGGANDVFILDGTTGLDDCGGTRFCGLKQTIGEGEEGVRCHNGTAYQGLVQAQCFCRILTFANGDAC